MLKNYWITAWRNLVKNKAFSFINIFGLTVGLTVCLMIFLFIMSEFSVDGFHTKGKNIYRVMRSYDPGKPPTPYLAGPYAPTLLNDFPGEIRAAVRVLPNNSALVVYKDRSFYEKRLHIADSNFFTLFSFPFLKGNDRNIVLVRLKPGNLSRNIELIKNAYARVAPLYPFDYTFLDQKFDELYRDDLRQQNILSIFSGLAILIACLGLFGLTSFTVVKRTREIGVRKVLGSSVQNIIVLLSKELLKPVLLATLIALPVAYAVMHSWLQSFAYRTGLQWWIFVSSAFVTVAIALCTVIIKATKAALANPVKSLRTD